MKHLSVTSLGQISRAEITFGDLTVFVGEQASGKSIMLQLVKLILDLGDITQTLESVRSNIKFLYQTFSRNSTYTGIQNLLFLPTGSGYNVKDISTLNAENPDVAISEFGGLTTFSTKVADAVCEAMCRRDF